MAYVAPLEEEQQKKEGELSSGGVVTTAAPSSLQSAGAPAGEVAPKSKGGSGFTNLNRYIEANQGQGEKMAGTVAQNVGSTAQKVQSAGENLRAQALKDIEQATIRESGVAGTLLQDPTKVNKAQFQRQYNATYGGPKDVTGYDYYQQGTQGAQQLQNQLKAAQTQEGRKSLLEEAYNRPQYTSGQRSLDSFILGASEQGKKQLQDLGKQYSGITSNVEKVAKELEGRIGQAQQTTEQTKRETQEAYNKAMAQQQSELEADRRTLAEQQAARDAYYSSLMSAVTDRNTPDRVMTLAKSGIDDQTLNFLSSLGYDTKQIVRQGGALKLGDFIDEQQAARYKAMKDLLGQTLDIDTKRSGALGTEALTINRQALRDAREMERLRQDAQTRVNMQERARQVETKRLLDLLNTKRTPLTDNYQRARDKAAGILGLTQDDLLKLETAQSDIGQFISQGAKINTGDVLSQQERDRYAQLVNALGVGGDFQSADVQDEGGAFNVNRAGLAAEIARGAEILRQREAAARNMPKQGITGTTGQIKVEKPSDLVAQKTPKKTPRETTNIVDKVLTGLGF